MTSAHFIKKRFCRTKWGWIVQLDAYIFV